MVQHKKTARHSAGASAPVITIESLVGPADVVEIDGERYDLATLASFGLRANAEAKREAARIQYLEQIEAPTEADEREHRQRLQELVRMALPKAPPTIAERLGDGQLADIVVAFFVLAAKRSPRMEMLRAQGITNPIGPISSDGSSAATAAQ